MTFTLDTSGAVVMAAADHNYEAGAYRVCRRCGCEPHPPAGEPRLIRWSDLSPFAQGYVEGLFAAIEYPACQDTAYLPKGFSDLAPETLAAILKDCEAQEHRAVFKGPDAGRVAGDLFWILRQRGELAACPPLVPYLGDDGRVYLREALP